MKSQRSIFALGLMFLLGLLVLGGGKLLPPTPKHKGCGATIVHHGKGPRNWCPSCERRVTSDEVEMV